MLNQLINQILEGKSIKDFLIKYIMMFGVLMMIFYYIYPQALGVMGRSFIVPCAALGFCLYAYNRFPFFEVHKVLFLFFMLLFWFYFVETKNGVGESFIMTYLRTQMGFFFSAYFIMFILFNVHKKPKFEVIVGYITAAIILQCIITFAMNQNEEIKDFFFSLQMPGGDFDERTRELIEEQRLIGYGTGLFGAGMVAGYCLIFITYLISKLNLTKVQFAAFTTAYCFVFFIGLFSARTTTIGLAASVVFLFALYFLDGTTNKKQPLNFVGLSLILFSFGAGLATIYFPDYTEWAFEMFDNYKATGKFSTDSSDALYHLFYLPGTMQEKLFGTSMGMSFWGNDMGYTRLIFFCGIIGTFFFFGYQFVIVQQILTKDLTANLLILAVFAYCLVMNVKGFTDMNPTLYLFLFYFLFYKYYRYYPDLYRQRLIARQIQLLEEKKKTKE